MKTYVLIQTESSRGAVARELLGIPGVVSAHDLAGAFDAIAFATDSSGRPVEQIIHEIRAVPGVTRALPAPLIGSAAVGAGPASQHLHTGSGEEAA